MNNDKLLVIDCGGTQAYYTARRLRLEGFYCELISIGESIDAIRSSNSKGILLVGEDTDDTAPVPFNDAYTEIEIPILAIGSAARRLAVTLGAQCESTNDANEATFVQYRSCPLFDCVREGDHYFSRIDSLNLPDTMNVLAETPEGYAVAFGLKDKPVYGYQGFIETNDPEGLQLLHNFAGIICGCKTMPGTGTVIADTVDRLRRETGTGTILLPVFLTVESAVTARLLQKAVGNRLYCLFIDTGLLRAGDAELIRHCYHDAIDVNFIEVDAAERFLKVLSGVTDAAKKREIIQNEFSTVLAEQYLKLPGAERVALSTTYSDILRHSCDLLKPILEGQKPLEPLAYMFRDEVTGLADALNVPQSLIHPAPFSVSGLAIRCLGEVTRKRLDLLRHAEAIFHEEIEAANYTRKIAQSFIILTDLTSHGEYGYGYVCVLRAMGSSTSGKAKAYRLPYDLMENVVRRIIQEVRGISRVVFDITGRPLADLEWE